MEKNVGYADKVVRVIIGLALLSLLFLRQDSSRWFGLIGLIPLFTVAMSWCPLYTVLGIKTCPVAKK
ncbi:MAG: DUF2892 domain-containing protein [Steroidobacteraceae bacterium]